MRIRIATWNLHGCIGTDGRLDPPRIADVLAELDADVIGLQEVDWRHPPTDATNGQDQLAYLAGRLGASVVAGPNLRDHRGDYGNALLSRVPLLASTQLDLSVAQREPRGAIEASLEPGGGRLRVIVTHLGLGPRERALQMARIRERVADGDPDQPVVLVGDLNEWRPPFRGVPRLSPDPFTFSSSARTFPSRFPTFALDRILARPSPTRAHVRSVRNGDTRRASDHLPVIGDLEWESTGRPGL